MVNKWKLYYQVCVAKGPALVGFNLNLTWSKSYEKQNNKNNRLRHSRFNLTACEKRGGNFSSTTFVVPADIAERIANEESNEAIARDYLARIDFDIGNNKLYAVSLTGPVIRVTERGVPIQENPNGGKANFVGTLEKRVPFGNRCKRN